MKQEIKLLVRCPKCDRENWALAVTSCICVWCGYNGNKDPEFKSQ